MTDTLTRTTAPASLPVRRDGPSAAEGAATLPAAEGTPPVVLRSDLDDFERAAAQRIIGKLRHGQQMLLMEHLDGPRTYTASAKTCTPIVALLERGLIKFERLHAPRFTIATESGRNVIAEILGTWADMLCRYDVAMVEKLAAFRRVKSGR